MIDAKEINIIFRACLFKEEEIIDGKPPEGFLDIDGVRSHVGFHPDRVQQYKSRIEYFLSEIHPDFSSQEAGGTSFVNLPFDKEGTQWGEHQNADELLILGLAIDRFEYLMPREIWSALPGGMPYIRLKA